MKSLKSAYNIVLGIALVATLGACSDTTAPDGEVRAELTVLRTQEVQYGQEAGILPFTPTLTVRDGAIEILGQIRTPTPCYALSTSLVNANNVITLTVNANQQNTPATQLCAQVLVVRDYGAEIKHVPAGQYLVRVVHIIDTMSRTPDIVLEQNVTVK